VRRGGGERRGEGDGEGPGGGWKAGEGGAGKRSGRWNRLSGMGESGDERGRGWRAQHGTKLRQGRRREDGERFSRATSGNRFRGREGKDVKAILAIKIQRKLRDPSRMIGSERITRTTKTIQTAKRTVLDQAEGRPHSHSL